MIVNLHEGWAWKDRKAPLEGYAASSRDVLLPGSALLQVLLHQLRSQLAAFPEQFRLPLLVSLEIVGEK